MTFRGDNRAQSTLIGFILLFGILVLAFAGYQAVIVPDQNAEVEFNHNQEAQNQMQDVRSAIIRSGGTGNTQSAGVQLGTAYPARLIALNPPTSTGTLETGERSELEVEIVEGEPQNEQLKAYWEGSGDDPTTFTTQQIEYRPNYSEYGNPPDTIIEHSILYNRFEDGTALPQNQQSIVSGQHLSFVFVGGEYSRSQSGKVEFDSKPASAPSKQVTLEGEVNITLQTELPQSRWERLLADEIENGNVDLEYTPGDPNEVELGFNEGDYNLRLAKVDAGTQPEPQEATYIVRVGGETARVGENFAFEVRDRYNNPVPSAEVEIDGEGTKKTDSDGRVTTTRNSPGEVTAQIGDEDWEEVTTEVVGGAGTGEGGDTLGPITRDVTTNQEGDTVTQGNNFILSAVADSIGTGGEPFRSGTPIQLMEWESSGPDEERSGTVEDFDPDGSNRVQSGSTQIDTSEWSVGEHEVTVIAQDATGRISPEGDTGSVFVTIEEGENGEGSEPATISGTVDDGQDGIDGATVELYESSQQDQIIVTDTTDSSGGYELGEIEPDDYVMLVDADGFEESTRDIDPLDPGEDRTEDFTLTEVQNLQAVSGSVDTGDGLQLSFAVQNQAGEQVDIDRFSVDATSVIGAGAIIDNGNGDEYEFTGITQRGFADFRGVGNAPNADGTQYNVNQDPNSGRVAVIQDEEQGTVTFEEFSGNLGTLELTESPEEADVTVVLTDTSGEQNQFYFTE